jgi:uncharacterized membrane protein YuzA (DUF378 family)
MGALPADSGADHPAASMRRREAPLSAAVSDLFAGVRAMLADTADLVAAEAHVAMRLLVTMVLAAVGAAVLGVMCMVGLLGALVAELVGRGATPSLSIAIAAGVCALGSVLFGMQLRSLARRAPFDRSRAELRGDRR